MYTLFVHTFFLKLLWRRNNRVYNPGFLTLFCLLFKQSGVGISGGIRVVAGVDNAETRMNIGRIEVARVFRVFSIFFTSVTVTTCKCIQLH